MRPSAPSGRPGPAVSLRVSLGVWLGLCDSSEAFDVLASRGIVEVRMDPRWTLNPDPKLWQFLDVTGRTVALHHGPMADALEALDRATS